MIYRALDAAEQSDAEEDWAALDAAVEHATQEQCDQRAQSWITGIRAQLPDLHDDEPLPIEAVHLVLRARGVFPPPVM